MKHKNKLKFCRFPSNILQTFPRANTPKQTIPEYRNKHCADWVYDLTCIEMAQKISTRLCIRINGTPSRIIIATAQTNAIKPKSLSEEAHIWPCWTFISDGSIHASKKSPTKIMHKTIRNGAIFAISLRMNRNLGYDLGIVCLWFCLFRLLHLMELSLSCEVIFPSLANNGCVNSTFLLCPDNLFPVVLFICNSFNCNPWCWDSILRSFFQQSWTKPERY